MARCGAVTPLTRLQMRITTGLMVLGALATATTFVGNRPLLPRGVALVAVALAIVAATATIIRGGRGIRRGESSHRAMWRAARRTLSARQAVTLMVFWGLAWLAAASVIVQLEGSAERSGDSYFIVQGDDRRPATKAEYEAHRQLELRIMLAVPTGFFAITTFFMAASAGGLGKRTPPDERHPPDQPLTQ